MKIFISPCKHGSTINSTQIQIKSKQKTITERTKNTWSSIQIWTYVWPIMHLVKRNQSTLDNFTISIFLVVKSFMNLLMTKSSDCISDLVKGHASRPYSSTGKHLTLINWRVTYSEATWPIFAKTAFAAR